MRKQPKDGAESKRPKPQQRHAKLPAAANTHLAAQTRKILGKHYASKYWVR